VLSYSKIQSIFKHHLIKRNLFPRLFLKEERKKRMKKYKEKKEKKIKLKK